jgi:hypothetical protein
VPEVNKRQFHNLKEVSSQVCSRQLPMTNIPDYATESANMNNTVSMLYNLFTIGFRAKHSIDRV